MPGARAISFIDDITVILPPELSLDMAAIGKATERLQECLGIESISLNRRKPQALLADGVRPEQLTEEQRVAMDATGLTVVRQGMRGLWEYQLEHNSSNAISYRRRLMESLLSS